MSLKEMMEKLEQMKQIEIERFKEKYDVDKMTAVEIRNNGEIKYARIEYFGVDDNGEVYVRVAYSDEAGFMILDREHRFYAKDFDSGVIRKIDENSIDECIHYYAFDGYTGRYRKVLTLAGVVEEEVRRYKCKFCGKVRYH